MKKKKNKKVKERVDYDAMFSEEMIKRILKWGSSWNPMARSETERLG